MASLIYQGHEFKVRGKYHIHRVVALMAWPFNDIRIQLILVVPGVVVYTRSPDFYSQLILFHCSDMNHTICSLSIATPGNLYRYMLMFMGIFMLNQQKKYRQWQSMQKYENIFFIFNDAGNLTSSPRMVRIYLSSKVYVVIVDLLVT